jgi:hypothetical protein
LVPNSGDFDIDSHFRFNRPIPTIAIGRSSTIRNRPAPRPKPKPAPFLGVIHQILEAD